MPLVTTTLTSAEMIKYAANAFLAMKIGFANEIANICEHVGAEAPEVMTGIGLDSRIGAKFLNPGVGWGGSCFGKDVHALLHTAPEYGYDSRLLRAAIEVNAAQRQMVIQKLQEKLFILKGRTIGLLGLAFKPDTDDLRDAPSLHIAERLLQMGARVKAYDPIAMKACREQRSDLRIRFCESPQDVAADSDALVLVTEWQEFRELDLASLARVMTRAILVDGRNLFSPEAARAAGFDYTGIGRSRQRVASGCRTFRVNARTARSGDRGALDRAASGSPDRLGGVPLLANSARGRSGPDGGAPSGPADRGHQALRQVHRGVAGRRRLSPYSSRNDRAIIAGRQYRQAHPCHPDSGSRGLVIRR